MGTITKQEFHYTKYYKLAIIIVGMIFNFSLGCSYCSCFTVAANDRILTRRIEGETR